MKGKLLSLISFLILVFASVASLVSATGISWMNVYLNGHYVDEGTVFSVERGTLLNVKVLFETTWDIPVEVREVRIKAWIDGYRKEIKVETERFDIYPGRTYSKSLFLNLPSDMEEGIYTLHVMVTSNTQVPGESYKTIRLAIQRSNYNIEILSVDLSLPSVVNAGEKLNAIAVIKNRGSHKLEDVYIKAEIPELGIIKTIYIGDLYPYDYTDNTERDTKVVNLYFDIPATAKSGIYTLKVKAYNEDTNKETLKNFEVIGLKEKEEKLEETKINLAISEKTKKVKAGEKVEYTIILTNLANEPLTVQIEVQGVIGWATANIDKRVTILPAKGSQIVTLTLNVDEKALEGSHIFSIQVISGGNIIATQNLIAEVEAKKTEVGENLWIWIIVAILAAITLTLLIILIVILVKKKEVEEKPEEIYY